jgi:hypothetical protein
MYAVKHSININDGTDKTITVARVYNSVTSALKSCTQMPDTLVKWYASKGYDAAQKHLNERSIHGDVLHDLYGTYLSTKDDDIRQELIKDEDVAKFADFVKRYDIEPLAIEMPTYHESWKIAGSIDLICKMTIDGKRVIAMIDFKHSKDFYHEHTIQMMIYMACLFEHAMDDVGVGLHTQLPEYLISYRPTKDSWACKIRNAKEVILHYNMEAEFISMLAGSRANILYGNQDRNLYIGDTPMIDYVKDYL